MKLKTYLLTVILSITFFSCTVSDSFLSSDISGIPQFPKVNQEKPEESGSYFYFSYDDSASTAAVELVKYKLLHNELPPKELARPWEFLNYENFAAGATEKCGIFDVSMGLWERVSEVNAAKTCFKLGVYVASPLLTKAERPNIVLTLVVDVSGSMSTNVARVNDEDINLSRMELAKYGLLQMENALKPGDIINLVTFTSTATIVLENFSFTENTPNSLYQQVINKLHPQDSTNLDDGISQGYKVAERNYDPAKMNRVLIITDAYANTGEVDPGVISKNITINGKEGIHFSGIGVGENFNEKFLNELTETGKGAYFSLITKTDAKRVFLERFIALSLVAARDVRFRLDYPATLTHDVTASEESSQEIEDVQPTNFSYNTKQYFYEGFSNTAPLSSGDEFKLTVYYTDPATGTEQTVSLTRRVETLLGLQENNIRDAETIFLLTRLVGDTLESSAVENILDTFYTDYSSPLHTEYRDLISRHQKLSTGAGDRP